MARQWRVQVLNSCVVLFSEMKADFPSIYLATFGEPFAAPMPSDNDLFCFTQCDNQPQAWLLLARVNQHTAYISWGGVLPEFRGESDKHMAELFTFSTQQGIKTLKLLTAQDNIKMQIVALKNGFKIEGVCIGKDKTMEIMFIRNEVV